MMVADTLTAQPEPLLDQDVLNELNDLNVSFINLLMSMHLSLPEEVDELLGLPRIHLKALEGLTTSELKQMCRCPYALFDLQLNDMRQWDVMAQGVLPLAMQTNPVVAQLTPSTQADMSRFALSALHYVRHTIYTGLGSAKLVFGMMDNGAARFANIPLSRLQQIANQGLGLLQVRFADNPSFWFNLVRAARLQEPASTSAARMSGLHLITQAQMI